MSKKEYILKENLLFKKENFSEKKIYLLYDLVADSEIITKSDKPVDIVYTKIEEINYYNISKELTSEDAFKFKSKINETNLKVEFKKMDKCDFVKLYLNTAYYYYYYEKRSFYQDNVQRYFDSNISEPKYSGNWLDVNLGFDLKPMSSLENDPSYEERIVTLQILEIMNSYFFEIFKQKEYNTYYHLFEYLYENCSKSVSAIQLKINKTFKLVYRIQSRLVNGKYIEEYVLDKVEVFNTTPEFVSLIEIDGKIYPRRMIQLEKPEERKEELLKEQRIAELLKKQRFLNDQRNYTESEENEILSSLIDAINAEKSQTRQLSREELLKEQRKAELLKKEELLKKQRFLNDQRNYTESEENEILSSLIDAINAEKSQTRQLSREESRETPNYSRLFGDFERERERDYYESERYDVGSQQGEPFDDFSSVLENYHKNKNY